MSIRRLAGLLYQNIPKSTRKYTSAAAPKDPVATPVDTYGTVTLTSTSVEALYSYKAGRWLWNESQQLANRYVKFDLDALKKAAEEAAGSGAVHAEVVRLPEGDYSKNFLVTMHDGRELVVKIPNPNAGRSHYTIASEVATMDFVKNNLEVPVPKVLDYNSRSSESPLGVEYIIMEKPQGTELGRVWDDMKPKEKASIVDQLATIAGKLSKAPFAAYGSLYYRGDIVPSERVDVDDKFAIGPTTERSWFDDGRGEIDIYRGPWKTVSEHVDALANRELTCLSTHPSFPRNQQLGIYNSPGGYHPTKEYKRSVLTSFLKVSPYILPPAPALNSAILWSNTLHRNNILVDKSNPTQITSIPDWQSTSISPMFLTAHHPLILQYNGPKPTPFKTPEYPPNFEELSPEEQKEARDLYLSQALLLLYEAGAYKQCRELVSALRCKETLSGQIIDFMTTVFEDREPRVQKFLADLTQDEVWKQFVGADEDGKPSVPCPLTFSEEERARQKVELEKWERDIERKERVLSEVGKDLGWDGYVLWKDYYDMVVKLEEAKGRFLDREAKTPEEREAWEAVWPFRDD